MNCAYCSAEFGFYQTIHGSKLDLCADCTSRFYVERKYTSMENIEIEYDKELWIKAQNETLVSCHQLFQEGGYDSLAKFIIELERTEFVASSKTKTAKRFVREKLQNKLLNDRKADPNLKLDANYVIKLESPKTKEPKVAKATRQEKKEEALENVSMDKLEMMKARLRAKIEAENAAKSQTEAFQFKID